jgi:hypothetical protein
MKDFYDQIRIVWIGGDPDIQVACGSRVAIVIYGVAADHHVFNFVRGQQPQELFEVGW